MCIAHRLDGSVGERVDGDGLHRHEDRGGVHEQLLAQIEMHFESCCEECRGLLGLSGDLLGELFLIEGIATVLDGVPGEVLSIGK